MRTVAAEHGDGGHAGGAPALDRLGAVGGGPAERHLELLHLRHGYGAVRRS
jgi:hypothetical protein